MPTFFVRDDYKDANERQTCRDDILLYCAGIRDGFCSAPTSVEKLIGLVSQSIIVRICMCHLPDMRGMWSVMLSGTWPELFVRD